MVAYAAGETIDPTRNIPRALMYGSIIVTVCYIALNAVYMYILPLDVVVTSTRVAADAADVVVDGGATIADMGEHIFRMVLDIASGAPSKSEALGFGDDEFVPWQIGAVM